MNRLPILAFFFIASSLGLSAQVKLDDFGRIVLNTYLPAELAVPAEAKAQLSNKLSQIASQNGMGGSSVNPRFILTANVNILSKDIIPGPPQMIAQNIDITLFIGDALDNIAYASTTLSVKGVGTNENKSFIEALKQLNPKNKVILDFLEEGKRKIIEYYAIQCDFIHKDAATLAAQGKFDEAIYKLSLVPEVCQDCYFRSLDQMTVYFQKKIDSEGEMKLREARTVWATAQNPEGAEKAGDIMAGIHPQASCQGDVALFIKSIDEKLKADERARWQFKMKQYEDKIAAEKEKVRIAEEKSKRDDTFRENQAKRDATYQEKQAGRNFELDKMRISAFREIAVEQAKNQPKTVNYGRIIWK